MVGTMEAQLHRVRVTRQHSELGRWEQVIGRPDPRLCDHVRRYVGYWERTGAPARRRDIPVPQVDVVIEFGPPVGIVEWTGQQTRFPRSGGFVVGLQDRHCITETRGESRGIMVSFSLIGARRFFGLPMEQLAGQLVGLDELLGDAAHDLSARLQEAPDWETRFRMVDDLVLRRVLRGPTLPDWVVAAWRRIEHSDGAIDIATLVAESGLSRKQVAAAFREHFGMLPKRLARLVRFQRVLERLRSGRFDSWASVAVASGYYDQAHFIQDFRSFSGATPGEYLRRRLPDAGGRARSLLG